jgi:hypothetical protein
MDGQELLIGAIVNKEVTECGNHSTMASHVEEITNIDGRERQLRESRSNSCRDTSIKSTTDIFASSETILELGSAFAVRANILKGEITRLAEAVLERHKGNNNSNVVDASIKGGNSSGASIAANSVVTVDEAETAVSAVHVPSSASVDSGSGAIEHDVTIRRSLRGASNHGHVRTDIGDGGIVLNREGVGWGSNDDDGCLRREIIQNKSYQI